MAKRGCVSADQIECEQRPTPQPAFDPGAAPRQHDHVDEQVQQPAVGDRRRQRREDCRDHARKLESDRQPCRNETETQRHLVGVHERAHQKIAKRRQADEHDCRRQRKAATGALPDQMNSSFLIW